MKNFDFYNPTHIVFGKDRLGELDRLVPKDARVLITYGGGSVKKFGTLDKVVSALKERTVFEFGNIEPNPRFSTLIKAVEMVRKEEINFLLAVGGGSVMDGTKFIALAANYEGDARKLLTLGHTPMPVQEALPLGTVVTLPATGSEMNCGGVISHGDGKFVVSNPLVFPRFSILEPELTYTLPAGQVANGIVDTFVHTVEQYATYPVDARFQDRTAEGILQTLVEIGPATLENPTDYDARANLVWCATMALNGLIGAGVPQDWQSHMIGHELTAMFGLDHGQTLAVVMPAVWKVRRKQKGAKLAQLGRRVWKITQGSEDEIIIQTIEKTEAFFQSLGMKTRLSDYGIGEKDIPALVKALESHGMTALSETGDVTPDVSTQILKAAL